MELPSISTEPQTVQSANAPPMSSATGSRARRILRPLGRLDIEKEFPPMPWGPARPSFKSEPYRDRVKLARRAVRLGAGWEDIRAEFLIGDELAKKLVGLPAFRCAFCVSK